MGSPLADLIQRGESGAKSYDNYNRGTVRDGTGRERIRSADQPIDFSALTIGQVMDYQALPASAPDRLFAIGRFQVIPQTMTQAVSALGLDRDAAFTDAVQDRIFFDYLITQKRPAIHEFVTGQPGSTLHAAQRALSQEWASIADPATGRSYYDRPGSANHASITADETAEALNRMRASHALSIENGLTPAQAWARLHADPPAVAHVARTQDGHSDNAVSVGAGDTAVALLQSQLAQLGYTGREDRPIVSDGIFGPTTRHAVAAFQRDQGLPQTGAPEAVTRRAIGEALERAPPLPRSTTTPDVGEGPGVTLRRAHALTLQYDHVRYGFGDKNPARGTVDCSGWVVTLANATMAEINDQAGRTVFARSALYSAGFDHAARIIEKTVERSGVLLEGREITAAALREGMLIGEDNGDRRWDRGRYNGIDHITMVVRDPGDGRLKISQSRSGEGVELVSLERYLDRKQSNGARLFATDPIIEARGLLQARDIAAEPTVVTSLIRQETSAPPMPVADVLLRERDQGESVRALQAQLNRLGYRDADGAPLSEDAVFGPSTREAVIALQRDWGLDTDGIVGPHTRDALMSARDAAVHGAIGTQPETLQALFDAARRADPDALRTALGDLTRTPAGEAFTALQQSNGAPSEAAQHASTQAQDLTR